MSRILSVALATALAIGLGAAPALADRDDHKHGHKHGHGHGHGHDKHRHHGHRDDYRVVYVPAPAVRETHIYHHSAAPAPQRLPYGFAQGTCDRGLISSEMVGNVLGGVAGGVAGNQIGRGTGRTAAVIGGTILGVMVGGSVGRSMDGLDQGCVTGALDHLPDQRTIAWAGDSGERYRVMPVRSWDDGGRYCREYQASAVIGGRKQQTFGTACRQPDGQWEIVD